MKIKVVVHEAEEGGYWAEVPAIPGCATQGETMEELMRNLREAIEGCLSVDVAEPKANGRSRTAAAVREAGNLNLESREFLRGSRELLLAAGLGLEERFHMAALCQPPRHTPFFAAAFRQGDEAENPRS